MSVNQSFDQQPGGKPKRNRGSNIAANVRSQEELITEEKVESIILERVMKRLEGREDEADDANPHEHAEKLRLEVEKIKNAGNELVGIARSIEALCLHFNTVLEEYARGDSAAIKSDHDEFRNCMGVDVNRLE